MTLHGEGIGDSESALDFGQSAVSRFGEGESFGLFGEDAEDTVEGEPGAGEVGHPAGEEGEVRPSRPGFLLFALG